MYKEDYILYSLDAVPILLFRRLVFQFIPDVPIREDILKIYVQLSKKTQLACGCIYLDIST